MTRPLVVDICESVKTLKTLHRQETHPKIKPRLHALYLYRSGRATTLDTLCAVLNKSATQIKRWFRCYREQGLAGILTAPVHPGRHCQLAPEHWSELERARETAQFKTYGEIQHWIAQTPGQRPSYSTVHRWVRYDLKSKQKVARPQSIKQDEGERVAFKKNSK